MTRRFRRSEPDPKYYFSQRRKANDDWTEPIGFYLTAPFELLQFEVPADRVNSIFRQLIELPPGDSLTVEL
jgi:hypothetical protein